jgi:hypothetical protein
MRNKAKRDTNVYMISTRCCVQYRLLVRLFDESSYSSSSCLHVFSLTCTLRSLPYMVSIYLRLYQSRLKDVGRMVRRSLQRSAFLGAGLTSRWLSRRVPEGDVGDCVFEPHRVQLSFLLPLLEAKSVEGSITVEVRAFVRSYGQVRLCSASYVGKTHAICSLA